MQIFSANQAHILSSSPLRKDINSSELEQLSSPVANLSAQESLKFLSSSLNLDRVSISPQGAEVSRLAVTAEIGLEAGDELVGLESSDHSASASQTVSNSDVTLTPEEKEKLELALTRKLAQRDREVRTHEQAHAAIGGQYTSAPSYTYQRGPDGRLYAIAGEVRIDTSPIPNNPEATLKKAETIQRAALGVAEPSSADRAAATEARMMAVEARAEILQQKEAERAEVAQKAVATEGNSAEDTEAQEESSPTAGERLQEFREEQQDRSSGAAQSLEDFNELLKEVNRRLAEINQKLVDAGVFESQNPTGTFLDQRV